jgi:hypothetical protein
MRNNSWKNFRKAEHGVGRVTPAITLDNVKTFDGNDVEMAGVTRPTQMGN